MPITADVGLRPDHWQIVFSECISCYQFVYVTYVSMDVPMHTG
jgi:hypothetical protein